MLEVTEERLEAARLAKTGNWNIVSGSAQTDPVLTEMVEVGLLALIFTAPLHARNMDGVRLLAEGWRWLARTEQESQR